MPKLLVTIHGSLTQGLLMEMPLLSVGVDH